MIKNFLLYVLYGLVAGFSEYTPLSASAHQALFPLILKFNSNLPLLRFFVHGGALAALVYMYWQRLGHIYREMKIVSLSPRNRKRPPDMDAVMDARFVLLSFPAVLVGAVSSFFTARVDINLFWLAIFLILGAILIYIPDYIPGGNRKTKTMSPLDGLLLGLCACCSVIPGFSAVGLMLAIGQFRKCDKSYILDISILISGLLLLGRMIVALLGIVFGGFAGFSIIGFLGCFMAAAASFGGAVGAILMMRFLTVKSGFSGFAFYGWGLGLFSFILYLMV